MFSPLRRNETGQGRYAPDNVLYPPMHSAEFGTVFVDGYGHVWINKSSPSPGTLWSTFNGPIFDFEVGRDTDGLAVDSISTNGIIDLNGDAHGGYVLEYVIQQGTAPVDYKIFANNDLTSANYRQAWHGAGRVAAVAYNSADGGSTAVFSENFGLLTDTIRTGIAHIMTGPSGLRSFHVITRGSQMQDANNHVLEFTQVFAQAAISNLVRLDIVASAAGGLKPNSRFRLWPKK